MAESYSRIQNRIAQLQRQAEKLRRTEVEGVVKKIRAAIDAYGLTPEDLFGATATSGPRSGRRRRASNVESRYADGSGHTWGGRGPRPKWVRDAIAAGKTLAEFEVGRASSSSGRPTPAAKKRSGGSSIAVKYRDGDNTWTGRGSQPRWLRAALVDGKKLEDFAV